MGSEYRSRLKELELLLQYLDPLEVSHAIIGNSAVAEVLKKQITLMQDKNSTELASIYRCAEPGCTYGATTELELTCHSGTHLHPLSCGVCRYTSRSEEQFRTHATYHDRELPLRCLDCDFSTSTQVLLSHHKLLVHCTTYSYTCTLCGFSTNQGNDVIASHNAMHAAKTDSGAQVKGRAKVTGTTRRKVKGKRSSTRLTLSLPLDIQPKQEPEEEDIVAMVTKRQTVSDIEKEAMRYINTIDSVAAGGGSLPSPVEIEQEDAAPWWDTEKEIVPTAAHLTAGADGEADDSQVHCTFCGQFYQSDNTNPHQCKVIRQQLISPLLHCTICDYSTSRKKDLVKHCVDMHSRNWKSLVIKFSGQMESVELLCQSIEEFVPARLKSLASNLYVCYTEPNASVITPEGQAQVTDTSEGQKVVDESAVMLYRCTKCFKCFGSLDLQAGHKILDQCQMTTTIPTSRKYNCSCCDQQFLSTEEFTSHHLRSHTTINSTDSTNPDMLILGDSTTADSAPLKNKQFTEDALLMIDALQRVGEDNSTLDTEVPKTHHVIQAKIVADFIMCCQLCPFTADHTDKYMEHVLIQHCEDLAESATSTFNGKLISAKMETLYGCNFCDFICCSKTNLSTHMHNHAGRRQKLSKASQSSTDIENGPTSDAPLLLCQTCGFKTTSKSSLRSHVLKHDSKKRYQCEQCEYSSQHPSSLKVHIRSHTGYKPFMCSMCGKSFITNSELRKHEKRHAGPVERKLSCEFCGKAYATAQHLKVHLRRHTGDRPFKCTQCFFAATSKSVLVNHQATHTGEKNYSCHLCSFTCASSGTLTNHRRLKHNIVNKRTTLAETTPESILAAATVAGKARVPAQGNTDSTTPPVIKGRGRKRKNIAVAATAPTNPAMSIANHMTMDQIQVATAATNSNGVMHTGTASIETVSQILPGNYQDMLPSNYQVLQTVPVTMSQQPGMEGQVPYVSVIHQQPVLQ